MNCVYVDMRTSSESTPLPATLDVGLNSRCGLFEITGKVFPCPKIPVNLCADFVDVSLVGKNVFPVLRRIKFTQSKDGGGSIRKMFHPVLWVPIVRSPLDEIRLYITDDEGDLVPFDSCKLTCTLVGRHKNESW